MRGVRDVAICIRVVRRRKNHPRIVEIRGRKCAHVQLDSAICDKREHGVVRVERNDSNNGARIRELLNFPQRNFARANDKYNAAT